jgi:hypothetical protein
MAVNFLKKDNIKIGLVLGLLLPILAVYLQFLYKDYATTFSSFLNIIKQNKAILTAISTVALILNGLVFGILIQFKKYETAKGLFIPTVILSVAVLMYKLF